MKLFIQKSIKNEKAEKSGTAGKERKKGGKAEIFRKKRKRWQPWLSATLKESFVDFLLMNIILTLLAFLFGAAAYFHHHHHQKKWIWMDLQSILVQKNRPLFNTHRYGNLFQSVFTCNSCLSGSAIKTNQSFEKIWYTTAETRLVDYGPIRVRHRIAPFQTFATGRWLKDDPISPEDVVKREIRRAKIELQLVN